MARHTEPDEGMMGSMSTWSAPLCAVLFVTASCTAGGSTSTSVSTTTTASPSQQAPSEWRQYTDRSAGFSFRYLASWHLDRFPNVCGHFTGAMVSNVPGAYDDPTTSHGCSWPPDMHSLPPDGVVVMTSMMSGGPMMIGPALFRDTPLPLTMDQLSPAEGFRRWTPVTLHNTNRYAVNVWMGDQVSDEDRSTTAAILGSLAPWQPPEPAPVYDTCAGGWERQEPGSPGDLGSQLNAIDLSAPSDGWAVGRYTHEIPVSTTGGDRWPKGAIPAVSTVLVQHWDGQAWELVDAPDPNVQADWPGGGSSDLRDVADISPDDVWAVGGGGNYGLTEHWDGTRWLVVPSPKVNLVNTTLVAVDGTGPSDAWTVGSGGERGGIAPIIERWDGTRWSLPPVPDVGHRYTMTDDVSASSPSDAWVVGQRWNLALTLHWDGSRWRDVPNPVIRSPRLTSVVDLGPDDAWAVGATYSDVNGSGPSHALIEHWDGTRWTAAPLPALQRESTLTDVAASGPDDIWATGWGPDTAGHARQLFLHFDGRTWSSVTPPSPAPDAGWYVGLSATPGTAWVSGLVARHTSFGSEQAYLARSCSA